MDIEALTKDIKRTLQSLELNGKIEGQVENVEISHSELKGEHMASSCYAVTVKMSKDNKGINPIEIFYKAEPLNPQLKASLLKMNFFEKESNFFVHYLNDLKQFCIEKSGFESLSAIFPHVYYADKNCIYMENLTKKNYVMMKKEEKQSLPHAEMALKTIAKIHGASYAFISKIGLEKFKTKYPFIKETMMVEGEKEKIGGFFEKPISAVIQMLKNSKDLNNQKAYEKIAKYDGKVFETMCAEIASDPIFFTLNHGGLWINNMMFYEENGIPLNVKIFDMQTIRLGSPNLDVSYFLFTSVKDDIRRNHKDHLFTTYFHSLKEEVELFGGKFDFTFEEYFKDYCSKSMQGFFLGIMGEVAMHALNSMDIDKGNVLDDFPTLVVQWMERNPKDSEKACKIISAIIEEFDSFHPL